jgi:hypothetical protein
MKRRLFTILSALSLLLFVAVVVVWVRSYFRVDELSRRSYEEGTIDFARIRSQEGIIYYWRIVLRAERPADVIFFNWSRNPTTMVAEIPDAWHDRRSHWPGLWIKREIVRDEGGISEAHYEIRASYWLFAAAAALISSAPLALVARRLSRLQRTRRGRCYLCGYDVRATPTP